MGAVRFLLRSLARSSKTGRGGAERGEGSYAGLAEQIALARQARHVRLTDRL